MSVNKHGVTTWLFVTPTPLRYSCAADLRTNGSPTMSNIPARVMDLTVVYRRKFIEYRTTTITTKKTLMTASRNDALHRPPTLGEARVRQHAARNPKTSAIHLKTKRVTSRSSNACAAYGFALPRNSPAISFIVFRSSMPRLIMNTTTMRKPAQHRMKCRVSAASRCTLARVIIASPCPFRQAAKFSLPNANTFFLNRPEVNSVRWSNIGRTTCSRNPAWCAK